MSKYISWCELVRALGGIYPCGGSPQIAQITQISRI